MEPDKHLPQADRTTDVANQGDEDPAIPTVAPPQEFEPPKEKLRGFAASYAAYLKDQSENPDRDILAEDILCYPGHPNTPTTQTPSPHKLLIFHNT